MDPTPSNTTLLRPSTVAEMAQVSKPTIYNWLASGLIRPSYDAEGEPLFTQAAARDVVRLAEDRRQAMQAMRLPKIPA